MVLEQASYLGSPSRKTMNTKSIEFEIGFADAEFQSYERLVEDCVVSLRTWNNQRVEALFIDTVGVLDTGVVTISDIVEVFEVTPFFEKVLSQVYETPPSNHPYHLFQFLNVDGEASLEVIATSISLKKK